MRRVKEQIIGAGFAFFKATRLHRGLAPLTRGRGAILTLHHVRPFAGDDGFAPNRLLEVEPAFLDAALGRIRALGFDLVSLDEAVRRMARADAPPFVALTFDRAPFAAFVTTGFADRTARLWWLELEAAVRAATRIEAAGLTLPAATPEEKAAAFRTLYWHLRGGSEERLRDVIGRLADEAGLDARALVRRLCLDWDGVRALARHPLCTIGAHTLTHPMLAKHHAAVVRREIGESRCRIAMMIGLPVRHFSYPVGDPTSAGAREFAAAAELGFTSAVTTRPGMVFADSPAHALPRLSLNGNWQSLDSLEILLSGVPFALWNRGRRAA